MMAVRWLKVSPMIHVVVIKYINVRMLIMLIEIISFQIYFALFINY
jgi:hypothetical protein